MRLFICSTPLLALAMLASNYSTHLTSGDDTRSVIDPRTTAIRQNFKSNKTSSRPSPQREAMVAVLAEN